VSAPRKSGNVDQNTLKKLLSYDPETGVLTWIVDRGGVTAGSRAGSRQVAGYRQIGIKGTVYREHKVIWFYVHGYWSAQDIDHINGDRSDNRLSNLRLASRSQNLGNKKAGKNRSGFKGVSWCPHNRGWRARITLMGSERTIGIFSDPREAHAAYCIEAERVFGEFARAA
jgi:hypothetical protein